MFHNTSCYITRPQREQHLLLLSKDMYHVFHPSVFPCTCYELFALKLSRKSDVILLSFLRPSHSLSPLFCLSIWIPPPLFSIFLFLLPIISHLTILLFHFSCISFFNPSDSTSSFPYLPYSCHFLPLRKWQDPIPLKLCQMIICPLSLCRETFEDTQQPVTHWNPTHY